MLTREKWWDLWVKYLSDDRTEITMELSIDKTIDPSIKCCMCQEITRYHNMHNKMVDWAEKIHFQESGERSPWE